MRCFFIIFQPLVFQNVIYSFSFFLLENFASRRSQRCWCVGWKCEMCHNRMRIKCLRQLHMTVCVIEIIGLWVKSRIKNHPRDMSVGSNSLLHRQVAPRPSCQPWDGDTACAYQPSHWRRQSAWTVTDQWTLLPPLTLCPWGGHRPINTIQRVCFWVAHLWGKNPAIWR